MLFLFSLSCVHYSAYLWAQAAPLLVKVRQGECLEELHYTGELEVSKKVDIHVPEFQGTRFCTVKSVLPEGAMVQKGDVIMEFDDADFQSALEAARNSLELARAEQEKTRFELRNEAIELDLNIKRREIGLAKAKVMVVEEATVVSKVDVQTAKLGVELAELELKQARLARKELTKKQIATIKVRELLVLEAESEIEQLSKNITNTKILAPCDGIIYKPFVQLNNEKGRIEANKVVRCGDKLLELPLMDVFQGVINIPAADFPLIHEGTPATMTLVIAPQKQIQILVLKKELYPITRNERLGRKDPDVFLKEYRVTLGIPSPISHFRPGLTFHASLQARLATDGLFLPRAAVHFDDQENPFVWLPGRLKPRAQQIKTGRAGVSWILLNGGLKAGDEVLLFEPEPEPEPEEN